MSTLLFIFSGNVIQLFMDNEAVVEYGSAFLHGMCLGLPFLCMDFLAVNVFQACGMGKKSLVFALLRKIVLEIPALIILNMLFPLYGLAYAQLTSELVLAAAAIITLYKMFKNLSKKSQQISENS